MNYIVFDLEATCDRGPYRNEIIEIGAIKLNDKLEQISEFNRFVKPILNPILTKFCKELTSISQDNVDSAKLFPEVFAEFKEWIGEDYVLCSWGFYDKNQLTHDCELHKLPTGWLNSHISIKHQHQSIFKMRKGAGVVKALDMMGLQFEGIHHRGIDDAKNIAKVFKAIHKDLVF